MAVGYRSVGECYFKRGFVVNVTMFYIDLISKFVDGAMTADNFESKFIMMRGGDARSGNVYDATLDELFIDIDLYCGDKELFIEGQDIDEEELRRRCAECLHGLKEKYERGMS